MARSDAGAGGRGERRRPRRAREGVGAAARGVPGRARAAAGGRRAPARSHADGARRPRAARVGGQRSPSRSGRGEVVTRRSRKVNRGTLLWQLPPENSYHGPEIALNQESSVLSVSQLAIQPLLSNEFESSVMLKG